MLTKEGQVFGFGDDVSYGYVGNGFNRYEKVPVRIGANNPTKYSLYETKTISIAADQYHSMALGAQGEIYTWVTTATCNWAIKLLIYLPLSNHTSIQKEFVICYFEKVS